MCQNNTNNNQAGIAPNTNLIGGTRKESLTGGPLNKINESYYCNAKNRSVPVMTLIRYHKPKTRDELVALISSHQRNEVHGQCPCGARSQGTLEDFGQNLYEANLKAYAIAPEKAFSLEACKLFMYNLFVVQSLKGDLMEDKALAHLKKNHNVRIATEEEDFKMGVDIVFTILGEIEAGVQVKPASYAEMNVNNPVVQINKAKNQLFGKPVFYLYYNLDGNFVNGKELDTKLNALKL